MRRNADGARRWIVDGAHLHAARAAGFVGGTAVADATGMRSLVIALLIFGSSIARADDGDYHDGGFDRGATAATVGGVLLALVYPATAISAHVGDGLCSLDYGDKSCNTGAHSLMEIPIVGGFLGPDDWSRSIGVVSSLVQITATGLIVGGLATHHWRVRN